MKRKEKKHNDNKQKEKLLMKNDRQKNNNDNTETLQLSQKIGYTKGLRLTVEDLNETYDSFIDVIESQIDSIDSYELTVTVNKHYTDKILKECEVYNRTAS